MGAKSTKDFGRFTNNIVSLPGKGIKSMVHGVTDPIGDLFESAGKGVGHAGMGIGAGAGTALQGAGVGAGSAFRGAGEGLEQVNPFSPMNVAIMGGVLAVMLIISRPQVAAR